jgi:hypothetical protein
MRFSTHDSPDFNSPQALRAEKKKKIKNKKLF